MSKVARIELTSSTIRLGGGRFGRLLRVALREHANSRQTNRLLLEALVAAKQETIPSDRVGFQLFVYGPVSAVLEPALGQHVADAVVAKVEQLLSSADTATSGVQRISPTHVMIATANDDIASTLTRTMQGALRAKNMFSLIELIEKQDPDATVNLLLDGSLPGLNRGMAATLARLLPARTRVVQWGGLAPSDEIVATRRWDCIPAPPDIPVSDIRDALVQPREVPLILIVDDSEVWRTVLTRMMTEEGYDVIAAHNGFSGLAACMSHRPSVVLTDYDMPVMHGGQLAQMVKDRFGSAAPPVIMVTSRELGHELPGVRRTVMKSHARDTLLPLLAEVLLEAP